MPRERSAFRHIACFEIRFWLRSWMPWIFLAIIGAAICGAVSSDEVLCEFNLFNIYRADKRRNRPCLRGRGPYRKVCLCDEFRLEQRLDVQRRYFRRVLDAHRDDMNMSISRRTLESVFNRRFQIFRAVRDDSKHASVRNSAY